MQARFYGHCEGQALCKRRRPKGTSEEVTIVEFSDSGERLKTVHVPKVVKTEEEWRKQLSRGVFAITRQADTELAYSGEYWNLHEKGLYRCICCDNALFISDTKFDSGTGWPSFWAPIAPENVRTTRDASLGMVRTAVSCTECDAHLGHVFDDGPRTYGSALLHEFSVAQIRHGTKSREYSQVSVSQQGQSFQLQIGFSGK